jgi:hypothetical protein
MGHVAAPELTSFGRRGLELRDMWQCRSSPQQGGEVLDHGTRGSAEAHLDKEARSVAAGYVAAPKPTSAGRRDPKLRNTWQRRSSTQKGGEVWSHGTRGGTGVHLDRKVRSEAAGHMEVPEPTSIGMRGPKLQGSWQRVDVRLAPCLYLKLVCGGIWSAGYRQFPYKLRCLCLSVPGPSFRVCLVQERCGIERLHSSF